MHVESLCQTCRGPHIQCNADLWMEAVLRHWLPSTNLDCSGQDGSSLGTGDCRSDQASGWNQGDKQIHQIQKTSKNTKKHMQLISTNINLILGCFFEKCYRWCCCSGCGCDCYSIRDCDCDCYILYYHSPKLKLLNEFIPQPHCCKRAYFFS